MKIFMILTTILGVFETGMMAEIPSVCEQCQATVRNVIDASTNPLKMSQLKVSLSMMCIGTSHQQDCHQTINHLDFIVRKMSPYLKDTYAVCSKLQMCSTDKFNTISEIAMLFLNKAQSEVENDNLMKLQTCEQCKASAARIHQLVGQEDTLHASKAIVQHFICRSAGKYHKACNVVATEIVEQLVETAREVLAEQSTVCADLGLCQQQKLKYETIKPTKSLNEVWRSMGVVKAQNDEQELMSCFECTLTIDAMLEEFVNKRNDTSADLRSVICGKVVGNWTDGCDDFLNMYLPTVLFLTYKQFDGREVCTAMHTCEKKNAFTQLSIEQESHLGCGQCSSIENFFAENSEHLEAHATAGMLSNLCEKLPTSFYPLCARSTAKLNSKLFPKFSEIAKSHSVCQLVC